MSPDPELPDAFRALRESANGETAAADRTRRVVLARARENARNRRRMLLSVSAFAAVLAAAAAWAAVSARLGDEPAELTPPTKRAPSPVIQAPPLAPEPSAIGIGAPRLDAPSEATSTVSKPAAEWRVASSAATLATPAPSSVVVSSAEQAAYDAAHAAHFVARDPAAALRGWDAYLASYPNGRFAQEAAYNRGISLVRLGRRAEAEAALAPFARGAYAGYRQREARELLDALSDDASDGTTP